MLEDEEMFQFTQKANTSKAACSAAPSSFSTLISTSADITSVMSAFFFPVLAMLMPALLPLLCIMLMIKQKKIIVPSKP